jgi:sporulation protein YabP
MDLSGGRSVHNISLEGRSTCTVTGVKDVLMSDSEQIELVTEQDKLLIKGQELSIVTLDIADGQLKFKGRVDAMCYLKSKSVWKRKSDR